MAAEETSKYAKGFRFDPFDEELITDYLKPVIMGKQLPCNFIKFRQVYGPTSNPWHVFPNDDESWFFSPHLKDTEKCMFVFSKLSKLSRSATLKKTGSKKAGCVTSENTSKKAGCGTWDGKTTRKQIRDGKGNVVGERRYFVFEINEIDSAVCGFDWRKVGLFRMHEYSLSGINAGLDSAHSVVLCKITYDSSKACPINLKPGNNKACPINLKPGNNKACLIDLKSGNIKVAGNVAKSSGEPHERVEIVNKNLEVMHGGVNNWSGAIQFQELDGFSQGKEETINKNLEGLSSVTAENVIVMHGGVDEQSGATQFQELDASCGDFGFDNLGSESFCLGDLGDVGPSFDDQADLDDQGPCFDVDWIMRTLECDEQEGPVEDDGISNLGKRKFEAEENSSMSQKTCL